MTVDLNGEPIDVADGTTLLSLVEQRLGSARGAALVVDGAIVPRGDWPRSTIADGSIIELITAVQGG